MISINSNTTNLRIQNTLSKTTSKLNTAIERMSSGYRINKAADDAASVVISSGLQSRINSLDTTSSTVKTAKTLVNTMDSSIAQMISELNRVYDLCVEASSDTLTTPQRDAIQNEINSNIEEIYRQKNSTNVNGKELFGQAEGYYDFNHLSEGDFEDLQTEEINGITYTKGTDKYVGRTYYFVETAEQLQNINNKLDGNFILMNDIDLSGVDWTAIGNATTKYTGVFEGNGYTISNLTIDKSDTDYQGLFGYTDGAIIQDVTLQNVNVTGKANTGGLVGYANKGEIYNCRVLDGTVTGNGNDTGGLVGYTTSTISNCYTTGNVSGSGSTGGLVGYTTSTISNCYATGDVTGKSSSTGGLVGYNSSGTISNCYTTGNATGTGSTGGLVGYNYSGTISNCYATGDVKSTGIWTGGFVGINTSSGTISNCYAAGNVTNTASQTGGFVGYASGNKTITNCYATGNVTGTSYTGGFVGRYTPSGVTFKISNCYATGDVTGSTSVGGFLGGSTGNTRVYCENCSSSGSVTATDKYGGFGGELSSSLLNCTVDSSVTCNDTPCTTDIGVNGGIIGNKTTTSSTYTNVTIGDASFDPLEVLGDEWKIAEDGTITLKTSCGITTDDMMARLTKNASKWSNLTTETINGIEYVKGTYNKDGKTYYQVETAEQLQNINNKLDGNYMLMNDIDLSGIEWTAIGNKTNYFQGTFDGNGHTISNLTIDKADTDYQGLFGYSKCATIKNLTLKNANVKGGNYTGSLVGYMGVNYYSRCTIENCSAVNVKVEGKQYIGGLLGYGAGNVDTSYNIPCIITNSSSSGEVQGSSDYVGGLCGYVEDTTSTNCYSTCNVNSSGNYVGGLCGYISGTVSNCYATGNVTSTGNNTGGFVGYTTEKIVNCYATGDVTSTGNNTGGFVGYASGNKTITNCYATGNVTGTSYTGGFVGINISSGTISNCYALGDVEGTTQVGGFCGYSYTNNRHKFENCNALGKVKADSQYGGLIGSARNTNITGCTVNSTVTCNGTPCTSQTNVDGGIIGSVGTSVNITNTTIGNVSFDPMALLGDEWEWVNGKDHPTLKSNPQYEKETGMRIQIAYEGSEDMNMYLNNEFELGRMYIDVSTSEKAAESLNEVNRLLKICNDQRSLIGCDYNILESVEYSNTTSKQNMSEALSTIQDADMAKESSEYTKQQILQEAAASLLVQANQSPTIALQLIYGGI